MTRREKRDADLFRQYMSELRERLKNSAQRLWPHFLFHFTDIRNVASILERGNLLSRHAIVANEVECVDIASPTVIQQTDTYWQKFVRFYFRPRTPTLFNNEGFRPKNKLSLGAHCPVPVYLLFDFDALITREDAQFSRGTLARGGARVYSSFADFKEIPFNWVYHEGAISPNLKTTIKSHRQAEVIIPDQLDLHHLKYIWCRSAAERETLKYLLSPSTWQKWNKKIRYDADHNFFFRYWLYVTKVDLDTKQVQFHFNQCQSSQFTGPFTTKVVIKEISTGSEYIWEQENYTFDTRLDINLSNLTSPDHYDVFLYLDNHLAYASNYLNLEDIPF